MANRQPWWYQQILPEKSLIVRPITNPWDIVVLTNSLGRIVLPGFCKVEVSHATKTNVKEAMGRHYATITAQGYKACDVIITNTCWTPAQWDAWDLILRNLKPSPSLALKDIKFTIEHPACFVQGITDIVIEAIAGPNPSHMIGAKEIKIKAIEYNQKNQLDATRTAKGTIKKRNNAADQLNHNPSSQQVPSGNSSQMAGPFENSSHFFTEPAPAFTGPPAGGYRPDDFPNPNQNYNQAGNPPVSNSGGSGGSSSTNPQPL